MNRERVTNNTADQILGAITDLFNEIRYEQLRQSLSQIEKEELIRLNQQEQSFIRSLRYTNRIKDFLNKPENILGSNKTKFGEVAEVFEVNIRNAYDALNGKDPSATFEGIGRTAAADYKINGVEVQSKFINGVNNNLKHVLEHMDKYQDFSQNGYYHIPKDSYEVIMKIYNNESVDGLSQRTIQAVKSKIAEIEIQSNQSFSEVVKASSHDYSEVQLGKASETLNKHISELENQNEAIKADIKNEANEKRIQSQLNHQPGIQEALKVGAIGAVIGGTMSAGMRIFTKCKDEKKSITDFNSSDWAEIGFDFAKNGTKSGISGVAIYGLTNFTSMGAPVASGFVSSTWGVASLASDYACGKITVEEFIEQGQIICLESSVVTLGAIVGQTLIPIPIVGTLVGSIATQMLLQLAKGHLGKREQQVYAEVERIQKQLMQKIEFRYRSLVNEVIERFETIEAMINTMFDFNLNTSIRLQASVDLGIQYGVTKHDLLQDIKEIDSYFLL